ncbi:MAG: helix-turn-helix domain-containing protein [Bacillota bacterium]
MRNKLNALIENAVLNILDFDIHTYPPRVVMNIVNRVVPYYIMSYIKQGLAQVRFRNRMYATEPGTVVILPPGEPHDHVRISHEPAVFLWWNFTFKIAGALDVLRIMRLPLIFKLADTSSFEELFCSYMELTKQGLSIPNLIRQKAKSLEVMAHLLESAVADNPVLFDESIPDGFIHILLDILEKPCADFHLAFLAAKYHMHPTYISNRFKSYFGVAPMQLSREILLEKAKALLKSGDMTVGQVATTLGYKDLSAFSRFFASHTGVSPLRFKNVN